MVVLQASGVLVLWRARSAALRGGGWQLRACGTKGKADRAV